MSEFIFILKLKLSCYTANMEANVEANMEANVEANVVANVVANILIHLCFSVTEAGGGN